MTTSNALERLAEALTEAPEALRSVLNDWDNLDGDQREHYASNVEWILASVRDRIDAGDPLTATVAARVEGGAVAFAALSHDMDQKLGFRPETILPAGHAMRALKARVTGTVAVVLVGALAEIAATLAAVLRADASQRTSTQVLRTSVAPLCASAIPRPLKQPEPTTIQVAA